MNSIIELMEYHFGVILDKQLIKSFESGQMFDDEDIAEFYTTLGEYTFNPYIPERKECEMRAFVGYSHSKKDMIFYDVDNNAIDLDYFKRLLLYYERVVITIHTEFFYEKMWDRSALLDLMKLLLTIKPLVEKNIVSFVSEDRLYNVDSLFQKHYKLLTKKDLPDYINTYHKPAAKSKNQFELNPKIIADLNACSALDLDYVTTSRSNWNQVKSLIVHSSKENMKKEAQHFWATSLVSFDLPDLNNLTYRDIVSIRNNSQAFEDWRRMLDELFDLISKNQPNSFDAISREIQYFSEHKVKENKQRLDEEIKNSSLKEHLKNNFLVITVSFLGQLLASNFLDITLTNQLTALLVGSSGVASVVSYEQKRRTKSKNHLLSKYCSLLEEASLVDPHYFELSKKK